MNFQINDNAKFVDLKRFLALLWKYRGKRISITLAETEHSQAMRNYYFILVDAIVEETGNHKDIVHAFLKDEHLETQIEKIFGKYVEVEKSIKKLSDKKMSIYIDKVIFWMSDFLKMTAENPQDYYK